jgi:hypothetical protein
MPVSPLPGVNPNNLLNSLRSVYTEVSNLRSGGGLQRGACGRLLNYLEWTSNAVRMLGNQINSADLQCLVLTRRHELLLSGVGNMTSTQIEVERVVNSLVSLELDERVDAFNQAIKELEDQIRKWSRLWNIAVLDTRFYIEHEQK